MSEAIKLYRQLLRSAAHFSGYNFRQYAIRRIRDGFHSNKNVSDAKEIEQLLFEGHKSLAMLKRQTTISAMFTLPDLVIENSRYL